MLDLFFPSIVLQLGSMKLQYNTKDMKTNHELRKELGKG